MKKNIYNYLTLFVLAVFMTVTVSCAKQIVTAEKGFAPAVAEAAPTPQHAVVKVDGFVMEDIFFAFDKSILTPKAQDKLKKAADYLRANPDKLVTIEGNCDERGTVEYNLALGERRAQSAKNFLVDLGVNAKRIDTVSFGEEKPVCTDKTAACFQKNRRDHFVQH